MYYYLLKNFSDHINDATERRTGPWMIPGAAVQMPDHPCPTQAR